MGSKKLWIISGAAAVLLAAGGATVLAVSDPAPLTHEQILRKSEEEFGRAPQPPAVADLKDQLAKVQATAPATPPAAAQEDPQRSPEDRQKAQDDWQKAELLKQQIAFAEHAPSPMPTGHSAYVESGRQP
jgi:hypothetical protein